MSSKILRPEATRELLVNRVNTLEGLPSFGEPTPEMYEVYEMSLDLAKENSHETKRGKREISIDLDMTVSELESLFIGKSVLDIGCGEGRLSDEIARLKKKTRVTALDNDPEVLSRVHETKNLTPVLGSGFNVQEALGDEEFDVVISAFSSLHWAQNADQKQSAVESAIKACKVGGKVLFVPIAADIGHKDANRKGLDIGIVRGYSDATREEVQLNKLMMAASDWLEVLPIKTLLSAEERGEVACEFVSSKENDLSIPIARWLNGPNDPKQERYSAKVDVLSR